MRRAERAQPPSYPALVRLNAIMTAHFAALHEPGAGAAAVRRRRRLRDQARAMWRDDETRYLAGFHAQILLFGTRRLYALRHPRSDIPELSEAKFPEPIGS